MAGHGGPGARTVFVSDCTSTSATDGHTRIAETQSAQSGVVERPDVSG